MIAFYITPGIEEGIRKGTILATILEPTVLQMRMCVAKTVHVLEGRTDQPLDSAGALSMLDTENIKTWKREDALAPPGWKPIFTVE